MVTKKRSLVDSCDYVFTDLQPISTGEKEGFKRMFKELNPEITKISQRPGTTPRGEPFVENIGANDKRWSACVTKIELVSETCEYFLGRPKYVIQDI